MSQKGCSGLLDSLIDLCNAKYGEYTSKNLCANIAYVRDHGRLEHKILLWMVAFSNDPQMQQFVCGLDENGCVIKDPPVNSYVGPDGVTRVSECPIAVHNYLHWLYREILYWLWNGHHDTPRLFAAIRSYWVYGGTRL